MIELVVLERHIGFICRGNRDSSFPNFSGKWRGSPLLVHRRQLYFCRFAHIGSIPDFTADIACQTIIWFPLLLCYEQVWTRTSFDMQHGCNVLQVVFEKHSNKTVLNHVAKQIP